MTADEIRELGSIDVCVYLREIAAQMAETNSHLAKLVDHGHGIAVMLCASNDIIPIRCSTEGRMKMAGKLTLDVLCEWEAAYDDGVDVPEDIMGEIFQLAKRMLREDEGESA